MTKLTNDLIVTAISNKGAIPYRFGKLKNDFIKGELAKQGIEVSHIYIASTNESFHVSYHPRAGFKITKK